MDAVQASMDTAGRFERAPGLIDRIKSLVEDVSTLPGTYSAQRSNISEQRANELLLVIALLGAMAVPKAVRDLVETWALSPPMVAVPVLLLAAAALWLWRRKRSGRA